MQPRATAKQNKAEIQGQLKAFTAKTVSTPILACEKRQ